MLALTNSAWETLFSHPQTVPLICVFGMIVLVVCVPAVARYWHLNAKVRAEADLKHAMIQRGMSAEEIERVLQARSSEK